MNLWLLSGLVVLLGLAGWSAGCRTPAPSGPAMARIQLAEDRSGFVIGHSGKRFVPWGFNYDHDRAGRLIEDYWDREWAAVEEDFSEMKALGANTVRIHLQLGRFMNGPRAPNPQALARLNELLQLSERTGLYLDLTGLGCYHKADVPAWYDALSEADRWTVQARFWSAVAGVCRNSPAVFCYDLMNEPVVPGGDQPRQDWLGPAFAGKHFVQFIALDRDGRARPSLAKAWVQRLAASIREQDAHTLVTVGLVDWSLDRPGLTSGFEPAQIGGLVDFVSVHLYPEAGKVDDAIQTLRGFDVGKPILIEETFSLRCGPEDFRRFMEASRDIAEGWIGFYWGETPEELRRARTIPAALTLQWLEFFQSHNPQTQPGTWE